MPKTVVLISASSDIGKFLGRQYSARGWKVIGTYRQKKHLHALKGAKIDLLQVDITKPAQIKNFISHLKRRKLRWDRLICLAGSVLPAQDFFDCDFDRWEHSVFVNAIGPLRLVHGLYPLANKAARLVFFAGGGANGTVVHMSAYAISKIMLTKMTEFLDAEYPKLHVSIIGPGWTLTKIHQEILNDKKVAKPKRIQIEHDLKNRPSTPFEDIDACIEWVCSQPKKITSGRNFSVVHDPWRRGRRQELKGVLEQDVDMFKLRRHGNNFFDGK